MNGFLNRIWTKLTRFTFTKSRLTRRRLDTFVACHASDIPALAVHSHDIDIRRHFPNAVHVRVPVVPDSCKPLRPIPML